MQSVEQPVADEVGAIGGPGRPALAVDRRHPAVDALTRDEIAGERQHRLVAAESGAAARPARREGEADSGRQRRARCPFRRRRARRRRDEAERAG